MLTPKSFADLLQAAVSYRYYANEFPVGSPDAAAFVRLTGGYAPSTWTSYAQPSVQVVIRGPEKEAVKTEKTAYDVFAYLHQKREFQVGDTLIRFCTADQSSPIYAGRDENGRLLYSLNFTCVIA